MAAKKTTLKTVLTLDGGNFRRGLARAQRDLRKFEGQANAAFRGAGIAAGAAAVAVGTIGARFEQSMANISAVTGKTGKDLEALEETARKLGKSTSFSASQSADALLTLSKAGLKTEESIAAVEGVLKFAGAASVEMGSAAEFAVGTMKSFGKEATDMSDIVNTLFATTTATNAGFEDLAAAMQDAAPVASVMGLSLEDTAGALGTLAQQNVKGTKAATALNESLKKLNDPSAELKAILGDVSLETDGLAGVIERLEEKNFDLRDAFKETYFGARGGRAISILMNQGSAALRANTAAVTGTTAALSGYDRQQATTIGALARLRSAAEEVAIAISSSMGDRLMRAFDALAAFLNRNTKKIVETFAEFAAFVSSMGEELSAFFGGVATHSESLISFAQGLGVAAAAVYGLAVAQRVMNAAMNANPVKLLATAVIWLGAQAIVPLVKRLGGWSATWLLLVRGVKTGWAQMERAFAIGALVFRNFGEWWRQLPSIAWTAFRTVIDVARTALSALGDVFGAAWDLIRGKLSFSEFQEELTDAFSGAFEEMKETVAANAAPLWQPFAEAHAAEIATIDAAFRGHLDDAEKEFAERMAKLRETAETAVESSGATSTEEEKETPAERKTREKDEEAAATDAGNAKILERQKAFQDAMDDAYDTAWNSILEKDMTGKARREAIWESMRSSLFASLGKMVKGWITSESTMAKVTALAEKSKTTSKAAGAGARAAIGSGEMAQAATETSANVTQASSGFFAAFSKIPFVGVALALGAIAAMIAAIRGLPKFASGGLVGGRSGTDQNVIRASGDEFVVNSAATRANLPLLEAINSGRIPGVDGLLAGAGGGGGSFHLHVGPGSLLVADDEAGLDRVATMIHDAMERGVKTRFRDG